MGCGLGFGEPDVGELPCGVPADGPGELFPETSPRSRVEGKSPGNGSMALRGAAHVDVPRERLVMWWGRSRPSPKSRGVQSPARGSPWSLLRGGKRVSRVPQHIVGCGMGQIQPIGVRSTARGQSHRADLPPFTRDTQAAKDPWDPHSLHPSSGAAPLSCTPSQLHSTTMLAPG